jgi:tetratricopeptide (TPR) repeat protein
VLDEVRISKTDPADLERIFQEASTRLLRDEYQSAAADFDRIVAVDPRGKAAVPSLYNAGVAYFAMGHMETALARLRASAEQDPRAPTSKQAWIRISRIEAYLERWADLEATASKILARQDLTVLERIEALGGKGLGLVEQGRVEDASAVIFKARDAIEDHKLGQAGAPPVELAQVAFTLGEIRRIKSEKILFVPFPANFGVVLEQRCTELLDAQSAYEDAMRSLDAHWSAMAGFRVGQLYQQLHRDVMQIPLPGGSSTLRQKQLWEGAMRLRYRILLEKGLKMMEGTVALGDKTGEGASWVARAREARKDLAAALVLEKEALASLPFTEAEIKQALDDLKKTPVPPSPKKPRTEL